jgi:arylsulfatase A-like enzyme
MIEGTSHGPFPYEVLYANMQMWVVPGLAPRVMRGIGRSIDFAPTVLDLAGIAGEGMDGESMIPHFDAGAFPPRDRYAESPKGGGCLSMVRADGLKLVAVGGTPAFAEHRLAVFDLVSDPYEYVNLIETFQGRELLEWSIARHQELAGSRPAMGLDSAPEGKEVSR